MMELFVVLIFKLEIHYCNNNNDKDDLVLWGEILIPEAKLQIIRLDFRRDKDDLIRISDK